MRQKWNHRRPVFRETWRGPLIIVAAILLGMVVAAIEGVAPPVSAQTKVIGISTTHATWAPWGSFTYATANNNGNIWHPTDPLTITAIDVSVATDVTGCTTFPILGVKDLTTGTWPVTITMSSGVFGFNATGLHGAVPAGDKLQAGIQTAGVGCTGTSGNVWFTVEYVMQ